MKVINEKTYPYLSINMTLLPEYGSLATTFVANKSECPYPSVGSNLNVNGSPTAIVVVGLP